MRFLENKQHDVNSGKDVQREWANARKTKMVGEVLFGVLLEMAGDRQRCMFCNDSHGTDVEHFRPKARYPDHVFHWANMLLSCAGCNRKKGDKFPLDDGGLSLLIDPSVDDPWEFLDFIPETGELTPLWRIDLDRFDPKGETTTDPKYLPLNIEAVTLGRQKTFRSLANAVQLFLDDISAGGDLEAVFSSLLRHVSEHSGYGLERWLFHFGGQAEEPFSRLGEEYPKQWERLKEETDFY